MKYCEYKSKVYELIDINNKIWKQTHIMFILVTDKIVRESAVGEEVRATYGIEEVWNEFKYKEDKILFFIKKYLKELVERTAFFESFMDKNIQIPIGEVYDEAIFYFDSFISSFSTIIEGDQRKVLMQYLNKNEINNFFPTRQKFGLFWEISILRNRILHFTKGRYDDNKNECNRFMDFLPKFNCISIDENENIHMKSTLIDIYKSEHIKKIINECIQDREKNLFDLLFPNDTPKGHGKKKPYLIMISKDIWFDHIESSIRLIKEIYVILDKVNNLFLKELLHGCCNIKDIILDSTEILIDSNKCKYSISDVFDVKSIEENNI